MTETPAETEEVWTYGGLRAGARGTRVHAWIDETGEELWFPKTGARASVGARYKVSVRRRDGTTSLVGVPGYTGRSADEQLRRRLWAEHTTAATRLELIRAERSDARASALDEALAPLLELARGLRTNAERDALAVYVLRKLRTP
jgi:hypothetical protein